MDGAKNNGTSSGETAVHFKGGSAEVVRVGSMSSSPGHVPKSGCFNLPILFERAGSCCPTPRFDSDILESEQWKSYFPQTHRRFQYALIYILVACVFWAIYFGGFNQYAHQWPYFLIGTIILFIIIALVLGFTYTRHYKKLYLVTSVFVSIVICVAVLLTLIHTESDLSTIGAFTASVEILLLIYSVIPLPLIITVIIGVAYSVLFEVFNLMQNQHMQEPVFIAGKILLHLCIHIMGVHIFTMRQVRQRSTFLKIGQSVIVRQDLEFEKQIKEKMIHSLMPPSVAAQVMKAKAGKDEGDGNQVQLKKRNSKTDTNTKSLGKGEIIFRTFNMNVMEDVSILFADIVGFTKMSSNKTAERLVGLLNDLFGRFDDLCTETGCEKISTLGDCYYCVAGCPIPKSDHAKCCVEMGLGMIEAIKQFDIDNNEEVNMRVGVHTGTVLCGIVGTRRFKFDVWSNDVILANNMESSGEPGRVHISETSLMFLKDEYEVEPGEDCEDNRSERKLVEEYDKDTSQYAVKHATWDKMIKTYFIVSRKNKDGAKTEASSGTAASDVQPDTVAISIEAENGPTESESLMNDAAREQQDANGIMTTLSSHLNNSLSNLDEKGEMYDLSLEPMNKTFSKIRNINHHTDSTKAMDLHIVKCIQEGIKDKEYLYKPPINQLTLAFTDKNLEENYRDHYLGEEHNQRTMSAPKYLSFLEIIVSFVVFIVVSIFCFVVFDVQLPWLIFFCIALVLEVLNIVRGYMTIKHSENKEPGFWNRMISVTSGWYLRNILGAVIASLPLIAVFVNFSCNLMRSSDWVDRYFCFCIVVSMVHYTNFTTLSSWMKSIIVFLAGVVLIILITLIKCTDYTDLDLSTLSPVTATQIVFANTSFPNVTDSGMDTSTDSNATNSKEYIPLFSGIHVFQSYAFFEIILDMLLLVFLIGFLNRESEISYRLNYHGDAQAWEYKQIMQENKDQADWLLHNIIPPHVSEVVRETSQYSKKHTDVGVIFAAIVNFNEIYDESYEGGREFLRVLNELVSDYEDLLDEQRFKDVEKIKTISSTFMAASGLNEISRARNANPKSHLYALMEFSTELQNCINRFNDSLFNFDFIMKIGFNFGEVVAGVIGTTKLLYDIWGDTVNISSRMYSTGVAERIQVPEACAEALSEKMEFEYRGEISVKGKGEMKTFLYTKTKDGESWPWE